MGDQIRTGIIGLGRSGRDLHGHNLHDSLHYTIAAVADVVEERLTAARESWHCRTYDDYRRLLAGSDVELVVIATDSASHCELTCEALGAGKAVVVDKPMAVSVEQADRMIAEAEKTGRLLTVFQNRRFDPDFLKVREVIDSGILGPVQFIRRGVYNYSRRTDWQALRKFGGGMLNNWGAHLLDQLLILLNYEVLDVLGDARHTISAGDAEDQAVVLIRGRSAAAQMDIFSCCAVPQPEWLVMGKYGTLAGTGANFTLKYCEAKSLPPLPETRRIPRVAPESYPGEDIPWQEQAVQVKPVNNTKGFYDRLYESIRRGQPLAVKPAECREVLRIIELCKQQSAQRK